MVTASVDVLVVGGGPAGCSTALALAPLGHTVALLELSQYADPRVGETLPALVRPTLVQLGVWQKFASDRHAPAPSIRSVWGTSEVYDNDSIFNPYGWGWHLDRQRFDAMLAHAAQAAGALVWRNTRASRWLADGGGWRVTASDGQQQYRFRARFLIDATGRRAAVLGKAGVENSVYDHLIGLVAFLVAGTSGPRGDQRTLIEAVEDGWWYLAPLPGDGCVAAFMTDADLYARAGQNSTAYWHAQLRTAPHTAARLQAYTLDGSPRVIAANSSIRRRVVGCGWLAVGDAASTHDPLSSQGVLKALRNGVGAAEALSAHFRGDTMALSSYARMVRSAFTAYLSARQYYYTRERRWPYSRFWRRRAEWPTSTGSWTCMEPE